MLHSPARPVEEIDEGVRRLAADMVETMAAAPGVGLAAPQVGSPLRMFVWSWTDDDGVVHSGVAVNPRLWIAPTRVTPAGDDDVEGCLSFPGERFGLVRSSAAILEASDLEGDPVRIEAEGWLARIFQHEYDHLDGLLYVDRLTDGHARTAAKVERKRGWGVPGQSWLPGVDHLED